MRSQIAAGVMPSVFSGVAPSNSIHSKTVDLPQLGTGEASTRRGEILNCEKKNECKIHNEIAMYSSSVTSKNDGRKPVNSSSGSGAAGTGRRISGPECVLGTTPAMIPSKSFQDAR